MKSWVAIATILALVLQPLTALSEPPRPGVEARLYLTDGAVITGQLIEHTDDLIIMQVEHQIFTFETTQVDKIITLDSLGSQAKTVTATEFPYISFLGGAIAFGLLSWLQFDRAADKDEKADLNAENGLVKPAEDLRDQADRARLFGWSSAVLATGSLAVALIPRKTTKRIFPELSFESGAPTIALTYRHPF